MLAYILTAIFRNLEYNIVRVAECVCCAGVNGVNGVMVLCRHKGKLRVEISLLLMLPRFSHDTLIRKCFGFSFKLAICVCVCAPLDFQTIPILLTHNIVNFMKTSKSGLIII